MGTRASFWIGNPEDLKNRKWLGCVSWDAYPGKKTAPLFSVTTQHEFIEAINKIEASCEDFTSPKECGWPFPWYDDLFLTDYTYAFFDDVVQVACFHKGFIPFDKIYQGADDGRQLLEPFDFDTLTELPHNVSAGKEWDRKGDDGFIVVARKH